MQKEIKKEDLQNKKALIFGVTGMDGSYLSELLLEKNYEVHGVLRRSSSLNTYRIDHLINQEALFNRRFFLHYGDLFDGNNIQKIIKEVMPDEIYNFAAMSQVRISYDIPVYTGEVTGIGFARIIEAVRVVNPTIKIYQACSSEMFGKVQEVPQKETTPFYPRSPYGCAKAYTYYLARAYREGYGMKIYCGILFNHESPRRGDNFLSKKVVKAAVAIKQGKQDKLYLGNLDAIRDWGYAKSYVYWIWKMVQLDEPDDFVIATGETHTVEEFVSSTFEYLGLDWKKYVEIDKNFMRPAEVDLLKGDYSKAEKVLGYKVDTRFNDLIKIMVDSELTGKI